MRTSQTLDLDPIGAARAGFLTWPVAGVVDAIQRLAQPCELDGRRLWIVREGKPAIQRAAHVSESTLTRVFRDLEDGMMFIFALWRKDPTKQRQDVNLYDLDELAARLAARAQQLPLPFDVPSARVEPAPPSQEAESVLPLELDTPEPPPRRIVGDERAPAAAAVKGRRAEPQGPRPSVSEGSPRSGPGVGAGPPIHPERASAEALDGRRGRSSTLRCDGGGAAPRDAAAQNERQGDQSRDLLTGSLDHSTKDLRTQQAPDPVGVKMLRQAGVWAGPAAKLARRHPLAAIRDAIRYVMASAELHRHRELRKPVENPGALVVHVLEHGSANSIRQVLARWREVRRAAELRRFEDSRRRQHRRELERAALTPELAAARAAARRAAASGTESQAEEAWSRVLEHATETLTPNARTTWFRPARPLGIDPEEGGIWVVVPTPQLAHFVADEYASVLARGGRVQLIAAGILALEHAGDGEAPPPASGREEGEAGGYPPHPHYGLRYARRDAS